MNHNITSREQVDALLREGVRIFWASHAHHVEADRHGFLWLQGIEGHDKSPMFDSKGRLNGKWADFFTL